MGMEEDAQPMPQMDIAPQPVREPVSIADEIPPQGYTRPRMEAREFSTARKKFRFPIGTALIALIVLAGCAGVLYAFSGAKVVVTPVRSPATVSTDLVAYADTGDLTFKQISVEKVATADVKSEGTKEVTDSAKGTITIHNEQTKPQALIKNTRFETPEGLIFRIHDSVTVPANGDLDVQVYADEAGEKYNIGPTKFTVPGLKGSATYTLVTATSKSPMAGGFVGTRASVGEATREEHYSNMQAELTTALQKQLAEEVPEGYVLISGTSFPTYEPAPDAAKDSSTVTLAEKGTITAVVFPEEALARAIAFKSIGTYDGSAVGFDSVAGLTVRPSENGVAPGATEFAFSISGNTNIVWSIDTEKIAGAVAGKSRDSAEIALKSFLEVDKATLVLRPFWTSTFPVDPAKITVSVAGEEPAS